MTREEAVAALERAIKERLDHPRTEGEAMTDVDIPTRIKTMRDLSAGWGAVTELEKIIGRELADALTAITAQAKEIASLKHDIARYVEIAAQQAQEIEQLRSLLKEALPILKSIPRKTNEEFDLEVRVGIALSTKEGNKT